MTPESVLPDERRQRILELLGRDGKVIAAELSRSFAVSEDTIRRDLRELDEAGKLQRVHGGALPRSPAVANYAVRQGQNVGAKATIAGEAAKLVKPGQVVFIDGGTTTLEVARLFPYNLKATFVTNSPPIALALGGYPHAEVIMTGGRLNKETQVLTGAAALESLQAMRADLCLLGICSLHPDVGISAIDLEEAHVKRTMILNAAEVVAVTTTDKLGTASPFVIAPIMELTHVVTEKSAPDKLLKPYRELGISVALA